MKAEDVEKHRRAVERKLRQVELRIQRDRLVAGEFTPLTRTECRAILDGGVPRLAIDARESSSLEVGQEIELSSTVAVRITKRSRTRMGEIEFTYAIIDNRERYLRRVPPATRFEADEHGNPKMPTGPSIRRAAEESAYDGNPRDPLNAGRAVPPDVQNALTMEAKGRFAEHRKTEAAEERAEEQARQVAKDLKSVAVSLARSGADPVEFLAGVKRQIASQREHMKEAA